jgi:hypothetical protein
MAHSISKKLPLTSLTSGGRSVGIVRLRTEAMEFFFFFYIRFNSFSRFIFLSLASVGSRLLAERRRIEVWCLAEFPLLCCFQNVSEVYSASCPVGINGCSCGRKSAGAHLSSTANRHTQIHASNPHVVLDYIKIVKLSPLTGRGCL